MVFISTLVNLLGLASSLWLGFYVVTRSSRSRVSWLTALTLWSLSSFFFANSLAAYEPLNSALLWPRFLVLFGLPLWLHLTLELIAMNAPPSQRRLPNLIIRGALALSYVFALLFVLFGIFIPGLILGLPNAPRVSTFDPNVGPLYVFLPIYLLLNIILALGALDYGRRAALSALFRKQFAIFFFGTGLAGLGGIYIVMGTWLQLTLPAFIGDAILAAGVTILGYAVARYNALIEGRHVEREFLYTLLAVGTLTLFYVLITVAFYLGKQISFLTLILTIIGSLSFNALYDGIRVALDRLFYRGQFVQLRQDLRVFARDLGTGHQLDEQLQAALLSFCNALQIKKGLIALRENEAFVVRATLDANPIGSSFPLDALDAKEIIGLVRPERKGLNGLALLVPLIGADAQIGAIVLGEKENQKPYSEHELEFLDEVAEMARVIYATRAQEENIAKISGMVTEYRERELALHTQLEELLQLRTPAPAPTPTVNHEQLVEQVEDCLQHLHDFSFLGEHPLANLRIVQKNATQKGLSISADRGKALSEVLQSALETLKPNGPEPDKREIPSRDWHPYIVLHDSYVKDEPNRDVMARLYVGEGTFNRTRRRALRNVAQALQEMEREAGKK